MELLPSKVRMCLPQITPLCQEVTFLRLKLRGNGSAGGQKKQKGCANQSMLTREVVQLLLSHAGFRVTPAENAAELLLLIATERFDVYLLDNWIPEISGLELCRHIRTFDQNTPILFCSGAVEQADIDAALLAGAQGYVGKPFEPDDLIGALRAALNKP